MDVRRLKLSFDNFRLSCLFLFNQDMGYLSDSYLAKAYDFLYNKTPESTEEAQKAYEEAMTDEDVADLLEEKKQEQKISDS